MPTTMRSSENILATAETLFSFWPRRKLHDRSRRAVVVHGGARDAYQLALALSEKDLLQTLVTDFFWWEDSGWRRILGEILPADFLKLVRLRSSAAIPHDKVRTIFAAGLMGLVIDRLRFIPFFIRRWCARTADAKLGSAAGNEARTAGVGLVSYSYFGYDAFTAYGRGGMLFQAHPHPATMRRILQAELDDHPECATSLRKEWELALPEEDFQHLVHETALASRYICASTFTRKSLIENGAAPESISVVPYGVDLQRFRPDPNKVRTRTRVLRLLFVGRINQRKGLKYLLDAIALMPADSVELMICGRVVDEVEIFRPFRSQVEIRSAVSPADLVRAYQAADLFVFPSLGEGFGQVLLEALACGLPILSTTSTGAPDLIEDNAEGFIVAPGRADLLAERLLWAINHREALAEMGSRARTRAESFTWARFRSHAADAVEQGLDAREIEVQGEKG